MMKTFCEIEDLRKAYHKRVPKMFQDYCESGSWTEQTLFENHDDFRAYHFRQRVGRDLSGRTLNSQMVGQDVRMPVAVAPVGLLGMQHPDGEILVAKACEKFGIPFTLSTMSICSIEDVADAVSNPFWFQLYVQKDRDFTNRLIDRADNAGCSAMVVTLDLQVLGKRHADVRNGMTAPPRLSLPNILDISRRPRWALGMLKTNHREFGNIQGHVENVDGMGDLMKWTAGQFDLSLTWEDMARFRDRWKKPMIIKGIMEVEDAEQAVKYGADAIIVSNHGGRQLDGARSSISALPEIVEAVGGKTEIWLDSGVRSGQDALKAIALGAKGVMIGRAMVYGLGANGEAGVTRALEIIEEEMSITLGFVGHQSIDKINKDDLIAAK